MVNLLTYKLFESFSQSAIDEIKSVLYILTDEGYDVTTSYVNTVQKTSIRCNIKCRSNSDARSLDNRIYFLEFIDRLRDIGHRYGFTVKKEIGLTYDAQNPRIEVTIDSKGKLIDIVRKTPKFYNVDSDKNIYKGQYYWGKGFILLKSTENFNIYLCLMPQVAKKSDRLYIIVYSDKFFNDNDQLKCVGLKYIDGGDGQFEITNNYRRNIGTGTSTGNTGSLETELHMDGHTFKTFNDAWYYIEEDWNEYCYPS